MACVPSPCTPIDRSGSSRYAIQTRPGGEIMGFEFGIFHEFSRSPGQTDAQAFAQSFAQVDAAERLGIDCVWLAELHFNPERSVVSSPVVVASAIAMRTQRIKIGIAV